jgi:hypothetical protein
MPPAKSSGRVVVASWSASGAASDGVEVDCRGRSDTTSKGVELPARRSVAVDVWGEVRPCEHGLIRDTEWQNRGGVDRRAMLEMGTRNYGFCNLLGKCRVGFFSVATSLSNNHPHTFSFVEPNAPNEPILKDSSTRRLFCGINTFPLFIQ